MKPVGGSAAPPTVGSSQGGGSSSAPLGSPPPSTGMLSPTLSGSAVKLEPSATIAASAEPNSAADRLEREVALGFFNSKIVGCRYYPGHARMGEFVTLVREPTNPYDANAIRVLNQAGTQIGHIPRNVALGLAKLMDNTSSLRPTIEVSIRANAIDAYELPITLKLYGLPESATFVNEKLRLAGERLYADPGKFPVAAATPPTVPLLPHASYPRAPYVRAPSVVVDRRVAVPQSQADLDKLFDQMDQAPVAGVATAVDTTAPPPALATTLFEHQRVGHAWMVAKETVDASAALPPFWTTVQDRQRTGYMFTLSQAVFSSPPAPVRGGILADDMGLGKSVQTLATVLANPAPGVVYRPVDEPATGAAEPAPSAGGSSGGDKLATLFFEGTARARSSAWTDQERHKGTTSGAHS